MDREDWERIAKVKLYGGGILYSDVERNVNELINEGYPVEVGGFLNKREAEALFSWADFILIPSRIESIPVVFSDAMQSLCPVIAMPTGDLPRLITEYEVGNLAKCISSSSFAEAIKKSLSINPAELRSNLVKASEDFSVDAAVNDFLRNIT